MSYKYMLLDSRGAPVAQGVSEDGPEKNVWQLRIAHGDIKRVLGHEYISLVGTSEQFPAMEGRIVRCRDNLVSVESVRMLGEEVRRNLRMPVRFESFLYPVSGRWRGRMPGIEQRSELRRSGLFLRPEAGGGRGSRDCNPGYSRAAGTQGKDFTRAALSGADSSLCGGVC